ncbi:MAG: hypothetical protein GY765_00125 [bacterium]|nr:hypothetical protein [bacterium]
MERKIFVTLCNIWEPATAARVARDARVDVNKASSYLKRLESRGSVSVVKEGKGKKKYRISERLYNIYHLMRLSGSRSDRVRAVVEFMVKFYAGEGKKMAHIAEEALQKEPESIQAQHLPASILGAHGKWDEALDTAEQFVCNSTMGEEHFTETINFFSVAAAAGYAEKCLDILGNSPCAMSVEPLIVALQMKAGQDYNAPQEVVEVAKDVLKKIDEAEGKLKRKYEEYQCLPHYVGSALLNKNI